MVLLANRVSALAPAPVRTSTSRTPSARAAEAAAVKISSARLWVSRGVSRALLTGIGAADLDVAEARGTRAVARTHHLFRLPLAAVRRAPQGPVLRTGNGRAGVPEFGRDAAVAGVFQHADALTVPDLPADLAPELKVVAFVVDRPALVGLHVNPVIGAENLRVRLRARLEAYVGHADERDAGPSVGAHGAVRAFLTHRGGRLARRHIANKMPIADDVGRVRGHALVVECECPQTGAVLQARVANNVHDFRGVLKFVQLVERQKAHARVVGFGAKHAVQLNWMADRFMNLQPELRAVQNQIEAPLRALVGRVQRHRFLGHARSIFEQLQLFHQFVALQLVLPAERVGVRALLDFAVAKAVRRESRAARVARLIDQTAQRGRKDLPVTRKHHSGLGQRYAGVAAQFQVDRIEQRQVLVYG